jgi:hypothetical protein
MYEGLVGIEMHTEFWSENLKRRGYFGESELN